jgi:hypothetical protein
MARKGDPTEERPHRMAHILHVPQDSAGVLSLDVLQKIADGAPTEPEKKKGNKAPKEDLERTALKLEEFLNAGGIKYDSRDNYKEGYKWILESCPFNPEHAGSSVMVTIADSGAMGFRCLHNSCYSRHWEEFRDHVERKIGHKFIFTEKPFETDPSAIVTNPGHLAEMIRASEQVLNGYGLKYFERHGDLVNTAYGRDVPRLKDISRDADSVIIIRASEETIVRDLDAKAVYVSRKNTSLGIIDKRVKVPKDLPRQIHDRVASEPRFVPYPSLDMVSGSPVLLPSGAVHGFGDLFEEGVLFVNAHTKKYPAVTVFP